MKITYAKNTEKNGIEISFQTKNGTKLNLKDSTEKEIYNWLKDRKFMFHKSKELWYRKNTGNLEDETMEMIEKYSNNEIKNCYVDFWETITNEVKPVHTKEQLEKMSIVDINKEIRKTLSTFKKFGMMFKVKKYHNKTIYIYFDSSPYEKLSRPYNMIKKYLENLLHSYNYTYCDGEYSKFYAYVSGYEYKKIDIDKEIFDKLFDAYDKKRDEIDKLEEEKRQKQLEEYENRQIAYAEMESERKYLEDIINENVKVVENEYFLDNVYMSKECKANTLELYKKEVNEKSTIFKVTKEIHFSDIIAIEAFKNQLLTDFDFLSGTGGSDTFDSSFTSSLDIQYMSNYEINNIKWFDIGVAVLYDNKLQFVVNCEGRSFCTYLGFTDKSNKMNKIDEIKLYFEESQEIKDNRDIAKKLCFLLKDKDIKKEELSKILKSKEINIKLNKKIIRLVEDDNKFKMDKLKALLYMALEYIKSLEYQLKDLTNNTQYTLITQSGFISITPIYLIKLDNKDLIIKKNKKQKSTYRYSLNHNSKILIYNGIIEIPQDVYMKNKGGIMMFDDSLLKNVLDYTKTLNIEPIVNTTDY